MEMIINIAQWTITAFIIPFVVWVVRKINEIEVKFSKIKSESQEYVMNKLAAEIAKVNNDMIKLQKDSCDKYDKLFERIDSLKDKYNDLEKVNIKIENLSSQINSIQTTLYQMNNKMSNLVSKEDLDLVVSNEILKNNEKNNQGK